MSTGTIAGKRFSELGIESRAREVTEVEEQQRMVRCSLSPTARGPVNLTWMRGKGSRPEPLFLEPGKSKVLPIDRAQVHFGPFALIEEQFTCTDERRREALEYTVKTEKDRVLKRFDYERPISKGKDGYEPTGPHRFPDVTVTVLNADGSESEPIRLHQLYEIGEFDPLKDHFVRRESPGDMETRHKTELEEADRQAAAKIRELQTTAAEALGMVKGVVAARKAS